MWPSGCVPKSLAIPLAAARSRGLILLPWSLRNVFCGEATLCWAQTSGEGARAGFLVPRRRGEWIILSILLEQLGESSLNLEFSKSSEFCARTRWQGELAWTLLCFPMWASFCTEEGFAHMSVVTLARHLWSLSYPTWKQWCEKWAPWEVSSGLIWAGLQGDWVPRVCFERGCGLSAYMFIRLALWSLYLIGSSGAGRGLP